MIAMKQGAGGELVPYDAVRTQEVRDVVVTSHTWESDTLVGGSFSVCSVKAINGKKVTFNCYTKIARQHLELQFYAIVDTDAMTTVFEGRLMELQEVALQDGVFRVRMTDPYTSGGIAKFEFRFTAPLYEVVTFAKEISR